MRQPTLQEEKKLWKRGYKYVVCLDEAGRGPLAGPVVAGAVAIVRKSDFLVLTPGVSSPTPGVFGKSDFLNIRDSKKLSAKQREYFYKVLTKHPAIKWGIGIVSEKVIDKINIKNAAELAMVKAMNNLKLKPDYLIIDGNNVSNLELKSYNLKLIVKGDEKVFSCAAASIIAKVTRDRIMMRYHKKYPQYGFDKHKGYPTEYHYQMIERCGPCQIHRKSYILIK
ncbi:MAG: ribonuclease HII [Candidatus Nealsonbacteria bacterium]|nr:ribonuclease HII [Candidatus Nealsonbacteria bacterium]